MIWRVVFATGWITSASKHWILGGVLQQYQNCNNDGSELKAYARSGYMGPLDANAVVFTSSEFVVVSQVRNGQFEQ